MRKWLIPATIGLSLFAPATHGDVVSVPARRLISVTPSESLAVFTGMTTGKADSAISITIVLVPGTFGSAFSMRHLTTAFATRKIPTVVIDLLGMGASPRPRGADYSLSRQATRIRAVLDTLGIERALIVAQGTSATAALHLAAEDRERVIGVLSLAGGLVTQQGTRGMRLVLAMSWVLDNPLGRAIGRRRFESSMREESADAAWVTREVMKQYMEPFEGNLRGMLGALRAMQSAVEPVLIADRLRAIQAPVHLLIGDKPSGAAPTAAQIILLRERLSSFRLDTIARSGIMLQEEQPDAVISEVLAMLRRPQA